ncbi:MAG: hypothetical protein ACTHN5_23520 [Phycisphaerae bacterium]
MDPGFDISDNAIANAAHNFRELCTLLEEDLGRRPTLDELFELLLWGLRESGSDLLSDVDPGRIKEISYRLRPARIQRVNPGDIVAVPAPNGKYYFGVFITKNRFGHAFGFYRGVWSLRDFKKTKNMRPCGHPIYTGLHALWDGTWQLVGHSPDCLKDFDLDPEIYHAKRHHKDNDAIGEFGAGERANNDLRQLDADEAARLGLLDGSYRQGFLATMVPALLDKWNCDERP